MIDSLGGPDRVNNMLTTLNIKPINCKSLKNMERRAGNAIETVANELERKMAKMAYDHEMK